jgi:uncharacterized protein (DUF488 family)
VFFTIGYEGLGISRFISILSDNGVKTLLDCRHHALSRNPDFSKARLSSHLQGAGIGYQHLKKLGVPGEIRKRGDSLQWYVANVAPNINIDILDRYAHPVCFMCMEKDLNRCHRKMILDTLKREGIDGRDLYPPAKRSTLVQNFDSQQLLVP